jgi:hypothetical protein
LGIGKVVIIIFEAGCSTSKLIPGKVDPCANSLFVRARVNSVGKDLRYSPALQSNRSTDFNRDWSDRAGL